MLLLEDTEGRIINAPTNQTIEANKQTPLEVFFLSIISILMPATEFNVLDVAPYHKKKNSNKDNNYENLVGD